jgi:hypothetical protein
MDPYSWLNYTRPSAHWTSSSDSFNRQLAQGWATPNLQTNWTKSLFIKVRLTLLDLSLVCVTMLTNDGAWVRSWSYSSDVIHPWLFQNLGGGALISLLVSGFLHGTEHALGAYVREIYSSILQTSNVCDLILMENKDSRIWLRVR